MDGSARTMNSSPLLSKQSFPVSFSAAFRIISGVVFLSHCIRINLHQCKRLVDFYRRARKYFDELQRSGVFVQEHLYHDVVRALGEGRHLIDDYKEENWRTSIENTGVNQDAFAKIYVESENCFRAICENIEMGVLENHYTRKELYHLMEFDTLAPLYFLSGHDRATLFERDAQMDKKHMLEIITRSSQNKNTIEMLASTTITTDGLRASLNREQGSLAEALLKNKEAKLVLIKKVLDNQLEEKKVAEERLKEKEMLVAAEISRREALEKLQKEKLLRERLEEELLEQKEALDLVRGKEVLDLVREKEALDLVRGKEVLDLVRGKEVLDLVREKEALDLVRGKEVLDLVREKEALATQEKLQRERVEKELSILKRVLEQKEYDLAHQQRSKNSTTPNQEELKATPSSSTGTDLLLDFKIQSSEIQIGDEIGSGTFATIQKCQWQNRDYAVKIFKATDMEELRTEVQNLVLLPRHPNIVLLVGFSIRETHGNPMLLMELLDGDLHTLVCKGESTVETKKKHKLVSTMSRLFGRDAGSSTPINGRDAGPSTSTKIDFIYQIAKGMLFLHKRKVFHGDLKAKNVLVKQRPGDSIQLKIADFGVSEKLVLERTYRNRSDSDADFDCSTFSNHSSLGIRHISEEGNVQQVVLGNVGTVRWMAPEVYGIPGTTDMKPYSMKADVYSFAMTCVEILTGQHPLPDTGSLKNVKRHVKNGGRPDLSTLKHTFPKALLHLVQSCWDANPSSRPDFLEIYSSMQKLKRAFPIN